MHDSFCVDDQPDWWSLQIHLLVLISKLARDNVYRGSNNNSWWMNEFMIVIVPTTRTPCPSVDCTGTICPYGFSTDANGCRSCRCRNLCDVSSCSFHRKKDIFSSWNLAAVVLCSCCHWNVIFLFIIIIVIINVVVPRLLYGFFLFQFSF